MQKNPAPEMSDSLLAVFPLYHRGTCCTGAAVSLDGLHWSSPAPLTGRCSVQNSRGRSLCHPTLLTRSGSDLIYYTHEAVPNDVDYPNLAADSRRALPRLLLHRVPVHALQTWTRQSLGFLTRQRHFRRGRRPFSVTGDSGGGNDDQVLWCENTTSAWRTEWWR